MLALNIIFMIISLLIIVITLLQGGKDNGLGVITGQNIANTFGDRKERGPEVVISRITFVLGVIFFTMAIIIHFLMLK
jgi:preprotein translocase subunit SecG